MVENILQHDPRQAFSANQVYFYPRLLSTGKIISQGRQMHEISLVRSIFKTLEDEFPAEIGRVRGIHLTVGKLSNVQPILMQNAFDAVLLNEPKYNKARLHVQVLPILVYCDDCKKTTEVRHYKFVCSCGKPSKNVVQGGNC